MALLDAAAERSRISLRARAGRLRDNWLVIVQAAVAVAVAWLIARHALGHGSPFFAPISALVALGIGFRQRRRRAIELMVGVAVGIGVADLIVQGIGTGTWQLAVIVALAMAAALLLAAGPIFITQAAVSAVLVVTLQPTQSAFGYTRVVDALVGGAVALAVTALIPADPVRLVSAAARPVLDELAAVLADVAGALRDRDEAAAERALRRARAIDAYADRFREALDVGRETATVAPPRRGARGHVEAYAGAARQLDLAVRNVRVLARGGIRALQTGDAVPPRVLEALDELGAAVCGLADQLEHPERHADARAAAIRAAALATRALEDTANLSVSVIVGQVRSTAVDLLRGMGMDLAAARDAVREAGARLPD